MSVPSRGPHTPAAVPPVSLWIIIRAWTRLGITGFGGPQAHVVMLRSLVVERHHWMDEEEFEHAVATTNLLPGPASTQLAIYCGWKLRKTVGALVAGWCFIFPGLALIIAASAIIFASGAPGWVLGAALGAGAIVPIIAIRAGLDLIVPSFKRSKGLYGARLRWTVWVMVGFVAVITLGGFVVVALLGCGLLELVLEQWRRRRMPSSLSTILPVAGLGLAGLGPLVWTAIKVGALSFGGGFVIIPLMQADAVHRYHWMTNSQFLTSVALGQLTPGPVVQTVASVGYAAGGLWAALLAAGVAFAPSFFMVILGGPYFDRFRHSSNAQAFLAGSGPAAIGAILGTSILLGAGVRHLWQIPLLLVAALWLLVARKGTLSILIAGAVLGALCGGIGLAIT